MNHKAQTSIGIEVASALVKFINTGSTLGSVNFPELDLRPSTNTRPIRIINVHQNVPGVLKQINKVLSEFNIEKQICDSKEGIAYFVADVSVDADTDMALIQELMGAITENVKTRVLY